MKPTEFIRGCAKYIQTSTEPLGSLAYLINRSTVRLGQPNLQPNEIIADLHYHPCINSSKTLKQTLDAMRRNKVTLCALTSHGVKEFQEEFTFEEVKKLIIDKELASDLKYKDKEISFEVEYKGEKFTFLSAYELPFAIEGIPGTFDMVNLMPNPGFEKDPRVKPGTVLSWSEIKQLAKDYQAMTIFAHPYTIEYHYGPFGFFTFRLANPLERKAIKSILFPKVDNVDTVAPNAAWMEISNMLIRKDALGVGKKAFEDSDGHGKNKRTRKEVGRSGNIFPKIILQGNGEVMRNNLREHTREGNFKPYHHSTPALPFLDSIAFGSLTKRL